MVVFQAITSSGKVDVKVNEEESPGETAGCERDQPFELKVKYESKQVYARNFL